MLSWNSKRGLTLGFGLLVTLMTALLLIGVTDMAATQRRIRTLVSESEVKSQLVTDMRYIARERSLSLSTMYLTQDPFQRDKELMRFNALAGRFILARQHFDSMKLTSQERVEFHKALSAVRMISAAQDKAVNAILSDSNPADARTQVTRALNAQNALLPVYDEIVDYERHVSQRTVAEAQRTFYENLTLMFMLGAISVATGILIAIRVISSTLRVERELFREKEQAQVTLHSIGEGVITTDVLGRIEYLNPVAESLTGWTLAEAKGSALREVYKLFDEASGEPVASLTAPGQIDGQAVGLEHHVLIDRNGRELSVNDSAAPIRDKEGKAIGSVLVFSDVTESRALARQLAWQATHDSLTGLVNRQEFERRLASSLDKARIEDGQHVLLYIDLDQFKVVNDTCGHVAGDQLLRQLVGLLSNHIRDNDTLARLGGDEFGVLLEGCPLEQGLRIAESMRKTIASFKFAWEEKLFEVGISIGLVPISGLSDGVAAVLSAADAACYAAKEEGRNRVRVSNGDQEEIRQHNEMQWVSRINKALEDNRLVLYAQEIKPVAASDMFKHYEILVRLRDEAGTLVPPSSFLPAAERYNLIGAIDRWVVQHTFEWLSACDPGDEDAIFCAINISGPSLGDDAFLDFVTGCFDEYGILPGHICFEVTETAAVANLNQARNFIARLREKGCCFALDDFGTGMSSYAYLKNLAVGFLKIDGVFVKDMVNDPVDFAMVESINRIGHVMGIKTIAEFVENQAILDKLRELGVDYAQGYGIHEPEPLSQLAVRT